MTLPTRNVSDALAAVGPHHDQLRHSGACSIRLFSDNTVARPVFNHGGGHQHAKSSAMQARLADGALGCGGGVVEVFILRKRDVSDHTAETVSVRHADHRDAAVENLDRGSNRLSRPV